MAHHATTARRHRRTYSSSQKERFSASITPPQIQSLRHPPPPSPPLPFCTQPLRQTNNTHIRTHTTMSASPTFTQRISSDGTSPLPHIRDPRVCRPPTNQPPHTDTSTTHNLASDLKPAGEAAAKAKVRPSVRLRASHPRSSHPRRSHADMRCEQTALLRVQGRKGGSRRVHALLQQRRPGQGVRGARRAVSELYEGVWV